MEDFFPMIEMLKSTFYCIAVDLPGHGLSPLISPLTLLSTLQALVDVLEHNQISSVSLVGYSLGGRVAMLLERYYPQLLKHSMILSAHPGLSIPEKQTRRLIEKKWITLLKEDTFLFLTSWYAQPLFKGLDLSTLLIKRCCIQKDAIIKVMQHLSITKQPSLWNHLESSTSSFLFLYGEYDTTYRELYNQLPSKFRKIEIPLCSHCIHLQDPITCVNHIKDFCSISLTEPTN
jgi:2-succinyl-6-hydroxy-2,4-cyclohexadiene-1-carboxylate synthase